MEFRLYNYFRSSASYRVRIALHLKNIPFEYVCVHLLKNGGEQNSAEYLAKNPMAQVPCLEHKGEYITQSMAILLYLEELYKSPSLFGNTVKEKIKIIELCELINSGIQPLQNASVMTYLKEQLQVSEVQKNQWLNHWITKGLVAFEKAIQPFHQSYSIGTCLTAVDLFLVPQMYAARRFGIETSHFELLSKIESQCLKLEAFQRAEPSQQPDSV